MYSFDIYCSWNPDSVVGIGKGRRDSTMAYEVVRKLSLGLQNLGHCITMDNYFTSIRLLIDLASRGIYGTGTIRINCIGIPSHLKNTKAFRRVAQGHMESAMHDSQGVSCVIWKDKCPVLLLSTYGTCSFNPSSL